MHTWLDIDAAALRHNFMAFQQSCPGSVIAPVVKSNAYGHGLRESYLALAPCQPAWLCVAYCYEAKLLRDLGYTGRILMVAPVFSDEFAELVQLEADILITHLDLLEAWKAAKLRPRGHIKIDSGLSRQGFLPELCTEVLARLEDCRADVVGLCTHFANVEDVLEHEYADLQLQNFALAQRAFRDKGYELIEHCSSSASALILEKSRFDMCRVGISIYGFWPSNPTRLSYRQLHQSLLDLKPALSWRCRIAMIKRVPTGVFIGYGCSYKAIRDMEVAVLPVGYSEGYPRLVADGPSYVLIRGRRCPLVGRISMNMMVVDVSHLEGVTDQEVATLIGNDGEESIDAGVLAGWASTIHYELVTRINPMISRRLVHDT